MKPLCLRCVCAIFLLAWLKLLSIDTLAYTVTLKFACILHTLFFYSLIGAVVVVVQRILLVSLLFCHVMSCHVRLSFFFIIFVFRTEHTITWVISTVDDKIKCESHAHQAQIEIIINSASIRWKWWPHAIFRYVWYVDACKNSSTTNDTTLSMSKRNSKWNNKKMPAHTNTHTIDFIIQQVSGCHAWYLHDFIHIDINSTTRRLSLNRTELLAAFT